MILYFAYRSNLDCAQMRERCPSVRFRCIAKLQDYRLAFSRCSSTRGCGVADVVPEKGRVVWGVVYEIDDADVTELDHNEGFREGRAVNSYTRRVVTVLENGNQAQPLSVQTYFATPQENPPPSNAECKRLIVDGAKFWNLPREYIRELERIEVMA